MNFQGLQKVEDYEFYLDVAIKRAKKKAEEMRFSIKKLPPLIKSKRIEQSKLDVISSTISEQLLRVLKSYPSLDNMPEFYKEIMKATIDIGDLKKSLASLQWCADKVEEFAKVYKKKINFSTEIERINQYRREFYGRAASALKQINPNLRYLDESRRIMLDYPSIKTSITTVAIAGFPNVGKSTLLSKLTPAKPKIANYAFTTTGVNQGFSEIEGEKIQFLDVPGTLDRFEQMNTVEKIATLAIKYLAEIVIYVFDLTETSYPIEKQIKLYEGIKEFGKPMIAYLSKTDLLDQKTLDEFRKKFRNSVSSLDELKERIKKSIIY